MDGDPPATHPIAPTTDRAGPGQHSPLDKTLRRVGALDLTSVRILVRVSEVGSITGAARGLGYSQPGLSQRVKSAEHSLGLRLFRRDNKGVTLTEIGAMILPYVRMILIVSDALAEQIVRAQAPPAPSAPSSIPGAGEAI
jgi:molybdenum-dependent DNA-binding transcriptional regulator ModE